MTVGAKYTNQLRKSERRADFGILLVAILVQGYLASSFSATGDWQVIAAGLRALAEGNADVAYRVDAPGQSFVYLPTAIIVAPFALLPWGKVLWITMSGAVFGLGLWRLGSHRTAALWMVHPYVLLIAQYGQTTLAVGGLIALALAELRNRCDSPGLLLGLALCIKPHLVVGVLPALLTANRIRAILFCAGVWLGTAGATLVWLGIGGWRAWLAGVETQLSWVAINQPPTTSYDVLSELLGTYGEVAYVAWCAIALAGVWLVWQRADGPARTRAAGLGSLTVSPYSVAYDYALLAVVAATASRKLGIALWLVTAGVLPLVWLFQNVLIYQLAWGAIVLALSGAIVCSACRSLKYYPSKPWFTSGVG